MDKSARSIDNKGRCSGPVSIFNDVTYGMNVTDRGGNGDEPHIWYLDDGVSGEGSGNGLALEGADMYGLGRGNGADTTLMQVDDLSQFQRLRQGYSLENSAAV